jgi:hypothetical protein
MYSFQAIRDVASALSREYEVYEPVSRNITGVGRVTYHGVGPRE